MSCVFVVLRGIQHSRSLIIWLIIDLYIYSYMGHIFIKILQRRTSSFFWCRAIVRSSLWMYWMVIDSFDASFEPHYDEGECFLNLRQIQTSRPWKLSPFFGLIYFSDLIPLFPIPCFTLLSSTPLPAIVCFIPSWFPLSRSLAPSMCLFFPFCLPPFFPALSQTHTVSLEMSWPLLEMAF